MIFTHRNYYVLLEIVFGWTKLYLDQRREKKESEIGLEIEAAEPNKWEKKYFWLLLAMSTACEEKQCGLDACVELVRIAVV